MLRAVLNVIWLVLCGLWMAIAYVLAGVLAFVLIITIPFGIAAFRIAGYVLWPFGRTIDRRPEAGVASVIGNVLWIVFFGWWLAVGHLVSGVLLCLTIIGIPLGLASFKIIPITLVPLGVRIVPVDQRVRRSDLRLDPPRDNEQGPSLLSKARLKSRERYILQTQIWRVLGGGREPAMANTVRDSRVTVPQLPPRHISRPRLLARLDQAVARPLILLSAGPGTGKTVLLTDWVRHTQARVAWLNPTTADAEPRRFWRLLESSLRECDGAERGPPADIPQGAGADLIQTLFSSVPRSPARLVVVIDDAHVLTRSDVLDGLDNLICGWQPGLSLILAARSDPLLPLHRYRLAGQMYELRAADLAMTPSEIREVLTAHHVTLEPRAFDILAARTEGWTAGVRLSAMRMEGTESPSNFVSELALDAGSIGEYLVNEVIRRQPEPCRRLLIETSFLDEVTGPLADAITGMTGCGDMLTDLARSNSFVIPLDAAQVRYRYHQLFAEILRYLLQRQKGQAVRGLHQRAAAWFEASGDVGNAVHWALRAGDRGRVATLLARGGLAHAFVHRQDLSGLGLRALLPLGTARGNGSGQEGRIRPGQRGDRGGFRRRGLGGTRTRPGSVPEI